MPLFRSPKDIEFIKRINQELIEKVIGEKITYYPISLQYSETNFYGESKEKVFDPPVEIYGLIEWQDQEISTTEFGQDIVYNLKVSILKKHLEDINVKPYEGDMVEYDNVKFEILKINNPIQIFGKEGQDIGFILECKSVRESAFRVTFSNEIENPNRTYPDEPMSASLSSFSYGNSNFAYSGSSR
jgi:hypothetical protein